MDLETVGTVAATGISLFFGAAGFFGWDQRYRLWHNSRAIAKLRKQRAYYVALAASEIELRAFLFNSLIILIALLFLGIMLDAMYSRTNDAGMLHALKAVLGAGGYIFACVTAGRLRTVSKLDRYLARVDAELARLEAK